MVDHQIDEDSPDYPDYLKAKELIQKIQSLIGAVVIVWASLDNDLIHMLAKLANCPSFSAGIIWYSLNALNTQMAILRGLANHNMDDKALKKEVLDLLTKIRELSATRNEFVHSVYQLSYDPKRTKKKYHVEKQTFRSERATLLSLNKAQTGEIEEHLRLVSFLRLSLNSLLSSLDSMTSSPSLRIQDEQRQKKDTTSLRHFPKDGKW